MPASTATKKFLQLARDRFKLGQEAKSKQTKRELEDIAFYNGEQWPEDVKNIRKGQAAQNGMPPVPARPMITINKTRPPIQQVLNGERQSDMGISIVPADDFGDVAEPIDETEIKLREGLVRRIQRESKAADARTWAFSRAVIAGSGYYGVMTRYVPGKTNDQEIFVNRFYNQACVTGDPAREQPDGSDAEWWFVATDLPQDAYIAEYPKRKNQRNALCDCSDDQWRALGDERPEWFHTDGETRMVRVVDYWYTVRESRELVTFTDGQSERVEWSDEVDELPDLEGWQEVEDSRRTVVEKRIKWAKLDGCDDDVLDDTDWLGPDMPIIEVVGEELQPHDKERRREGMVRSMRAPGYGFNVMVSRWLELIGLAPLVPVMVEEGTIEGYEDWWVAANTRTLPYLPYKRTNLDNGQANPPTVPPSRNPPIEAVAASVQMFDESIQSTSGIHASALGEAAPSVRSKRQNAQLIEQSQKGVSHFLDNLQRSIRYEGQVINNLLYPVFGRPGRLARIVNAEGDAETVLLHTPMVMQGGKAMPAPQGHPNPQTYTLTKDAKFNVTVKVSKNFDSRREQEATIIGELLAANPELMTWFGDLFFQNQDGPGHQQMADRAKVMLAPPIQQMLAAKASGQNVPPEVQAQLAQAQQQIQQLQAELQKAAKPTAVEEIRQQGQSERTHLELLADREKLHIESETKIAVAELGAKVDRLALFLEERARIGVQDHAVGMAAMDQAHAREMAERGQAHESAEAASGREATAEQAEAARAHDAEMAAQAAQQQPEA